VVSLRSTLPRTSLYSLCNDSDHPQGRIPDATLRCIRYVRAKYSAGVSVEVEKPGREGLEELAAEADVVFYSKSWAEVGDLETKLRIGSEGN